MRQVLGSDQSAMGRLVQVEWPATKKTWFCLLALQARGTQRRPCQPSGESVSPEQVRMDLHRGVTRLNFNRRQIHGEIKVQWQKRQNSGRLPLVSRSERRHLPPLVCTTVYVATPMDLQSSTRYTGARPSRLPRLRQLCYTRFTV